MPLCGTQDLPGGDGGDRAAAKIPGAGASAGGTEPVSAAARILGTDTGDAADAGVERRQPAGAPHGSARAKPGWAARRAAYGMLGSVRHAWR